MAASEVEETLKRLQSHKGVEAILIVNHDGVPLRSTMTVEQTKKYAEHMSSLCSIARSAVKQVDGTNDLTFLRVRTTKNEVMIAPDKEFMLIVVQNPHAEDTATVAPLATAAAGASAFDDDE